MFRTLIIVIVALLQYADACYFVRLFYSDKLCKNLNEKLTSSSMAKAPPGTCYILTVAENTQVASIEQCNAAKSGVNML